jgi:hypothetical protein
MKLVTFNRMLRGMGNPALVPDDVAAAAAARGEVVSAEDWPPGAKPSPPLEAHKPQTYLTKAARKLKGAAAARMI